MALGDEFETGQPDDPDSLESVLLNDVVFQQKLV
jgi:hypothetical protein